MTEELARDNSDGLFKWLALLVVVLGAFMAVLDTSIVNIAIPKMMTVFGSTTNQIEWVLTGYMLSMGIVIPLTGYLGDTFGTKRVYIFALTVFTIGSALCGFAWSTQSMIFFRIIQAIGGGMIMPVGMSIVYNVIPREQRGLALGVFGISMMMAPAIGPTLSGYIVEYMDWRLIFNLNVPIGILGVILAALLLRETERKAVAKFDIWGFLSSAVGLFSLLLALSEGTSKGWSSLYVMGLFALAIISLYLFVVIELNVKEPLLDLRILKYQTYTMANLIGVVTSIGLFGGVFLMPLYLENLRNLSAMQAGMLMFPSALATGITMPISGRLFDKIGAKPLVITGLSILTISTYQLHFIDASTSLDHIRNLLIIRGIGMGFCMMPATTAGMNVIPMPKIGRASALNNVIRQVSSSFGIAIITTIMQHQNTFYQIRMQEDMSTSSPTAQNVWNMLTGYLGKTGLDPASAKGAAYQLLNGIIMKQSFVAAIEYTFLVTTIICLVGIPMAFWLKEKRSSSAAHEQHVVVEM